MSAHVVVIGGGMAGCVAAVKARKDGAKVTLVRRGVGATALSTGAVSLDGVEGERAGVALLQTMVDLESTGDGPGRFLVSSGAVLEAEQVGPGHLAGELGALSGKSVLVCGLRGFPAMNAPDIARRLESLGVKATSTGSTPFLAMRMSQYRKASSFRPAIPVPKGRSTHTTFCQSWESKRCNGTWWTRSKRCIVHKVWRSTTSTSR